MPSAPWCPVGPGARPGGENYITVGNSQRQQGTVHSTVAVESRRGNPRGFPDQLYTPVPGALWRPAVPGGENYIIMGNSRTKQGGRAAPLQWKTKKATRAGSQSRFPHSSFQTNPATLGYDVNFKAGGSGGLVPGDASQTTLRGNRSSR